ncbi:MAG TPA: bifunctional YncE family protein/alkaline phosphatase family protein [Candidatus Limnocylindrales bacterium]|nr:bifunctional YncE family protein/alkaline phosphatase family protein [Candidatus Limnocylindrales bacterium]
MRAAIRRLQDFLFEGAKLNRPKLLSLLISAVFLVLAAISIQPGHAQNRTTVANQPASEGRPISPAGTLINDANTGNPAVGSLPVNFVRTPDHSASDGAGRFLVAVNSGYGIQFSGATNEGQQSLSVIDLNAQPAPQVVQNVYFPAPQSANVGAVFAPQAAPDGSYTLYVSGGFENKIWIFRFNPKAREPISPPSDGPETKVTAPFISVAGLASQAGSPRYNRGVEPVYPMGIALSPDGETLFTANNLGDSLGIIRNLRFGRHLERVDLSDGHVGHFVYPYGVVAFAPPGARETQKVYVSCWATATVAVKDLAHADSPVSFIPVGRHPTEMILNSAHTRLYVANSDADSVSVIDTARDRVVETISVRLEEKALPGTSPEAIALSPDGATLYVAGAHSNAIAVVSLSPAATGGAADENHSRAKKDKDDDDDDTSGRSVVRGFIPTGQYPSALAVADGHVIVGNGKGTGFANSSLVVDNSGRNPDAPNDRFPFGRGAHRLEGGEYDVAMIAGNYSLIALPDPKALTGYTGEVMRNDGLMGSPDVHLFAGKSPIRHIIYIIRENRTYDQVFGDIQAAGNGERADGEPFLAIFGDGAAAELPGGPPQSITPNAHALAERFGLFDRFFVNSEASPDGHNWSNAAFSSDYVDKAYRWNYAGRGRSYDFEGTNRQPDVEAMKGEPPIIPLPATADEIAAYVKRFVPYVNGARDVGEPDTLYLWDDAARAGISYRTFGEFMGTISQAEVDSFNANRDRDYPDLSPTVLVFPAKKALENHDSQTFRAFDLLTPDSMTTDSYRAAKTSGGSTDPMISPWNSDEHFRGYSRIASFLADFRGYVDALNKGQGDTLPALSIMHLPNDHTSGLRPHVPTPQFYAAENDYALGLLVQEVSSSPYWKDTAIFVLEDDAQDGPDHVDAHRSPGLVISAYNRPGALIHAYHNTVSMIRTMELLLGLPPMNQLDAAASPMDIFQAQPDLRPYKAVLPEIALNNLMVRPTADRETAKWIRESEKQDFASEDLADPHVLDRIIWFSVRHTTRDYPAVIAQMPAFDVMRTTAEEESAEQVDINRLMKNLLARRTSKSRGTTADRD